MISPYLTQETSDKAYIGDSALYSLEQFTSERNQLVSLTSQRSQYLQSLLSSGQWRSIVPEANVDLNTEGNVNEMH